MTIAITCPECGEEVAFWIDGEEKEPIRKECECGQTYELLVRKVAGVTK